MDRRIQPLQAEISKPDHGRLVVLHRNGTRGKKAALGLVNLDALATKINSAYENRGLFHLKKSFIKLFNNIIEKLVEGLPGMGHEANLVELFDEVITDGEREELLTHKLVEGGIVAVENEEESLYKEVIAILSTRLYEKIGEIKQGLSRRS